MAQKQLLADMSHEIRSPLSRLKVALELGRRSAGEAGAEALDTAERQADAIESLAAELLTYSRLDIGPYELVREAVAPGSLVEDALAPLLPEIESGKIKVETRLEGLPTSFSADRRLMERALGNVLRNAIEHAPEGSVLYIGGKEAEGRLMVTVTDQGRGVPPEHLERIFLPFTRVDSGRPRAGGGVGLGLAIARRCLEAHGGGALAGAGADGRGLTVTLWLPAAEATEPPPR